MMPDPPTTIVGLMHVALRIPVCRSLKEKRSAIKPCIHHLQNNFNLAISEVGGQNERRSAILAAVTVSNDKTMVERTLGQARRYFDSRSDLEVIDLNIEIL